MPRPKLELAPRAADRWLNAIATISLILLLATAVVGYAEVPETIPIHFNVRGRPDDYGSRLYFWIVPAMGVLLFLFFRWLLTRPHRFNYPVRITADNAEYQYRIATRLLRTLLAVILLALTYLHYTIIETSQGEAEGLGGWFTPLLLVTVVGATGYYFYLAQRHRAETPPTER
ncbi:DUF1648 domain-containing protein [Lewinella sp. IMCC34183]|uniref:DUF1648 domain-containing protein n=1 Tax=Lewinella sp. IMCC34183 TaxID=2248762 RepID=UPI000E23A702|nr:DUF1648 domain-containing protein [Lewinella sp. IMCC34183]